MTEQIRKPFCVFDVGLASGNLLHMLGVGHYDLQLSSFQDRVNRFPVNACAFHRQMGAALREQPFPQPYQLSRGGAEGPHLLLHSSVFPHDQQARHYRRLMHIQSTSTFHQGSHTPPLRRRLLRRRSVTDTATRPSHFWVRQIVVPLPTRVSLRRGIYVVTRKNRPSSNRFRRLLVPQGLTRLLSF